VIPRASSEGKAPMAWRGDPLPPKSLPLGVDGKPDYTKIDASPVSKVLIPAFRKLLAEEVGKDLLPGVPKDNFDALLKHVRAVNDDNGT